LVATKLKARFAQLLTWHCLNHRLELAVGDAVRSCTEINQFKINKFQVIKVPEVGKAKWKHDKALHNKQVAEGVRLANTLTKMTDSNKLILLAL